jgi:hypothetical protein
MKTEQDFEQIFRNEFKDIMPNLIWRDEDENYVVFGNYLIKPEKPGYRVFHSNVEIGKFGKSSSALSWCIADKSKYYNIARDILMYDNKLLTLSNDIKIRAAIGDRSRSPAFREYVCTKLETKIIQKKLLENQLSKWVNWAKYYQQKGINNETARSGRATTNKTSR